MGDMVVVDGPHRYGEGVLRGESSLFGGHCFQGDCPDAVARGEHVGVVGLIVLVYLDEAVRPVCTPAVSRFRSAVLA